MVTEILELPRKKNATNPYIAFAFAADTAPNAHDCTTASRHLSEVKHVPAQLVLRWVTASGKRVKLSVLVYCGCVGMVGDRRSDTCICVILL